MCICVEQTDEGKRPEHREQRALELRPAQAHARTHYGSCNGIGEIGSA